MTEARPETRRGVSLAAAAAASLLVLATKGDTVLLSALLGVAALSGAAGAVAGIVALSQLLRWGTTSLGAIAGAQAVLGPAAAVGSTPEALSAALSAAALILASPGGVTAVPFGLAAGAFAAGPAVGSMDDAVVRAAAGVAAVGLSVAAGKWLPRRPSALAAGLVAAAAAATALT